MEWPHIQTEEALDERDAVNRALAKRDFDDLKAEVTNLKASVDDLVKAWNTATSLLSFIKWAGGIATAATALWVLLKGKFAL